MHKNIHCRVFILYASAADAEIIFDKVRFMGMDQSDYVWIVSEQVASNFHQLFSLTVFLLTHSGSRCL